MVKGDWKRFGEFIDQSGVVRELIINMSSIY